MKLPALFKPKKEAREALQVRVACDFGRTKIVLLEVQKSGPVLTLTRFQKRNRPPEADKAAEVLRELFEAGGYTSRKLRISVKGQGVIVRFVQFPAMKPAELRSAISFEIDQYIPFKAHEVVWDFFILDESAAGSSGGPMSVLLAAVKRDELTATLAAFQRAGLEVELVDVDALALINALQFFHPDEFRTCVALLDIGTDVSTVSIQSRGKPRFIRDISFGGVDLVKRLKRKLGLTQEQAFQQMESEAAATPEAVAVLKESLAELVSDLKVSFHYYLDQVSGAEPVQTLFFAGGGDYHPAVLETLTTNLGIPVRTMNLFEKLQVAPGLGEDLKKNQGFLPVSLGLCVRDL